MIHLTGPILGAEPRSEAWIVDGRMTYTRPDGADAARRIDGHVVPGLVDAHAHIGLDASGATDRATAEAHARTVRASGVLLVREPGHPGDTRWIDERWDLPRVLRSGRHIARPKRYIRGYAVELEDVADLPAEMERQARIGDGWVKIVADWIDRSMGAEAVIAPLWPDDVLRDGIAAAHEAGARVCAHAFSHAAVDGLIEAGIDSIEHGTGMDDDQIAEAAARGIPVTPTLLQVENFRGYAAQAGAKYPAYAFQVSQMYDQREERLRRFVDAGVQLLPGSDAGGEIVHGRLVDELHRWRAAGVAAAEILASATWRARGFLGAPSLEEGAPADLVVYREDPRTDVAALVRPEGVFLDGKLVAPSPGTIA